MGQQQIVERRTGWFLIARDGDMVVRVHAGMQLGETASGVLSFEPSHAQLELNIVIVDLPPTLIGDDVLALAPRLDALLLVVAEGITDVDDLKRTMELLEPFELVGTILNNSRQKEETFSGYYHTASEK